MSKLCALTLALLTSAVVACNAQLEPSDADRQQPAAKQAPNPAFDWTHLDGMQRLPWIAALKPLEDMFGKQTQQATGQLYELFPQAKDAYEQLLKQAEQFTAQLNQLPAIDQLPQVPAMPSLASLLGLPQLPSLPIPSFGAQKTQPTAHKQDSAQAGIE